MRPRFTLLAALVVTLACAGTATAYHSAPHHNRGLTITANPNPVNAGDGVLIDGQLAGPTNGDQLIKLYHRIAGSNRGYTLVARTHTDSTGFYELPRAEGVVWTNRSWYVTGPDHTHSSVIHEGVNALVSLETSTTSASTGQPVTFAGNVTPNHAGESVALQQEIGDSDSWRTIKRGQLGAGSAFSITYRWRRPGAPTLRALFGADARNLSGSSDPVTVEIQQQQVPDFTIFSSQPLAPAGSTVTITGTLYEPGTSTPEADTPVQLWGSIGSQRGFTVLGNTSTDSQGGYSFKEANETYNTVYYVATVPAKGVKTRRTARLDQGVQDELTMTASAKNVTIGQPVTFSGTVMPDKAGENIYLERLGKDDHWHIVGVQRVRHDSTYEFTRKFSAPGAFTFRTRILGDGENVGARSTQATVTVSLPPPSGSGS